MWQYYQFPWIHAHHAHILQGFVASTNEVTLGDVGKIDHNKKHNKTKHNIPRTVYPINVAYCTLHVCSVIWWIIGHALWSLNTNIIPAIKVGKIKLSL